MGLLSFSAPWFAWKMIIICFHLQHWIYRNKSWKQSTPVQYSPCLAPANWGLWRTAVSCVSVCHSALFKWKCKSFQDKSSVFSTLCLPSSCHCIGDYEHLREALWGFANIFWVILKNWWRNVTQYNWASFSHLTRRAHNPSSILYLQFNLNRDCNLQYVYLYN